MFICIHMTRDELSLALQAVGRYEDNQHDMGADEGWGFDVITATLKTLEDMIKEAHEDWQASRPAPAPRRFDIASFALMCDAVATYFLDPSDLDDPAQRALADRMATYEDRAFDLD
jgi:hypothetical protein